VKSEIVEHVDALGRAYLIERFERLVSVLDIESCRESKIACEACPRYAIGNLACPPHSPYFPDYTRGFVRAKVICYRVYLDHVQEISGEPKYRTAHKLMRGLMVEELLAYRMQGHIIAGAGPCLACERCAAETGGNVCRTPSRLIYSLESLGVNLVSLSEHVLALKLEWSAGEVESENVAAIGAAFYR
jgi:predicted metal-binding protein